MMQGRKESILSSLDWSGKGRSFSSTPAKPPEAEVEEERGCISESERDREREREGKTTSFSLPCWRTSRWYSFVVKRSRR